MANYTIQIRRLIDIYGREEIENWFKDYNLEDYLKPTELEELKKTQIWSKDKLAKKIVDHYFMREIGFETPELFKHYAKVEMQELMEIYLPIIYTKCIEYDPFESVDFHITETREIKGISKSGTEGETTGNSNSNSTNNSSGLNINSDTPQTHINKNDLLNGNYSSNASASENTGEIQDNTNTSSKSTANSNTDTSSTETFTHDERGNKGVLDSYQKMIMQLRETFIAVDKEIIEKLDILFMGVY